MLLNDLQKSLLGDSAYDDMGLWVVIWEITKAYTSEDAPEIVRRKTLDVIDEMMSKGWIVIGKPVDKDGEIIFQMYPMSVDQAIEYIEAEWDKLGRFPQLGEVCWFRATPAGKQLADDLDLEG